MERLSQFFSSNFMMPHGACFLWLPEILWTHIVADLLIAFSYFSIPVGLYVFAKKRPDLPFRKIFLLFAAFITLCGLTHLFSIYVLWNPFYGLQSLLKLLTGLVSFVTAFFVWKILPAAISLPGPVQLQKMNRELYELNEEMEQKVRIRTEELEETNRQLEIARLKAEQASTAKSDFLAVISHEIRTPMNAIVVLSDKIAKRSLPEERFQEAADTLSGSAKSLMDLLNDMLDFSKIEAGGLRLESYPFQLEKVVQDCTSLFSIKAEEKGIQLKADITPQPFPTLMGDGMRIKQIIMNLVNNAIKFTEEGSIHIAIEALPQEDSNQQIIIRVKDTGIGIAEDKLQTVFEKFSQAEALTTRKYGGSGLGLSIARELAQLMGGDITIASEIGSYTEFTVNLLLKKAGEAAQIDKAGSKPSLSDSAPRRILLVEDTPSNILVSRIIIEAYGCEVDVAQNGAEALAAFQKNQGYALVLLDIHLPDMSGMEACKSMRAWEKEQGSKRTQIIAFTAYATRDEEAACVDAGMDGFLTKPLEEEKLEEVLTKKGY